MKRLKPLLNLDVLTVTGETLARNLERAEVRDEDIIRPLDNPVHPEGGIAVLRGNLAPEGAVIKQTAVAEEMKVHRGPAKVFDSEEAAVEGIYGGKVVPGDVVVVRYEGPKGGPGMREMTTAIGAIWGAGLEKKVALITDGRFSGAIRGPAIGYISPEAAGGGPIAVVRDGDVIEVNIPQRRLSIELSDEEIAGRLSGWKRPKHKVTKGCLRVYERYSASATRGAVLSYPE